MKKIIFIITSHSEMIDSDAKTGVWLGEFTDPYYEFLDAGFEVVLATPNGGQPPIDEMSKMTEHISGSNKRFSEDEKAKAALASTKKISEVKADDFAAVFFPGGHGPLWDLAKSDDVAKILHDFKNQNKIIGAVCHGSAAFLSTLKTDPDFVKDKKISCFSNAEEKLAMKDKNVPFFLEDELKKAGAKIDNGLIPFTSHTVKDGLFITGQNPLSAGPTAKMMIENLKNSEA